VIDVGPLGPVGPDGRPPDWIDGASPLELARLAHLGDLGDDLAWRAAAAEIRARWEAEHAAHAGCPPMILGDDPVFEPRGTPVWTASEAEPVMWIPDPAPAADFGPLLNPAWNRAAAGLTTPNEARALADGPARAQLNGLISAVNGLQNHLQSAGFAEAGNLAAPAERLARIEPIPLAARIITRGRLCPRPVAAAVAVTVTALVAVLAEIAPPLVTAAAALAACTGYGLAWLGARVIAWLWRQPARTADLYPAPKLIPPARTRAGLYAAARTRYLATGRAADLADMLGHVEATPDDGGPEWTAQ